MTPGKKSEAYHSLAWLRYYELEAPHILMVDDKSEKETPCDTLSEEQIDQVLEETFPASDPPSWTLGVENHCPEPVNNEQPEEGPARNSS